MKASKKIVLRNELSLVLFICFLVLFLWPFFSSSILTTFKSLFAYFFFVWGVSICIIFFVSRRLTFHLKHTFKDSR